MPDRITRALLIGSFLMATMAPAVAQQAPRDLVTPIQPDAPQEYVLARCGGYFKALLMTNDDAEERLKDQARATIEWFFAGLVTLHAKSSETGIGPVATRVAADIDTHARFYLDRQLNNIAETGQPYDDLIARDQNLCVLVASERAAK